MFSWLQCPAFGCHTLRLDWPHLCHFSESFKDLDVFLGIGIGKLIRTCVMLFLCGLGFVSVVIIIVFLMFILYCVLYDISCPELLWQSGQP